MKGKCKLVMKMHREALSTFRDCRKHLLRNKLYYTIEHAVCIWYISHCLVRIGRKQQGLHLAGEGENLLNKIIATSKWYDVLDLQKLSKTLKNNF